MSESDKELLRNLIRTYGLMRYWKDAASSSGSSKRAQEIANTMAHSVLLEYERQLDFRQSLNPSMGRDQKELIALRVIASETFLTSPAMLGGTQTKSSNNDGKGQKPPSENRGQKETIQFRAKRKGRRRATKINPSPAPLSKFKPYQPGPEPYRRNYKESKNIQSNADNKVGMAGTKKETKRYLRYADEGIGGTREQALRDRNKTFSEVRRRHRGLDE